MLLKTSVKKCHAGHSGGRLFQKGGMQQKEIFWATVTITAKAGQAGAMPGSESNHSLAFNQRRTWGSTDGALLRAHHPRLGTRDRRHCSPIWTYEAAVSGQHAASSFRTRVSDLNLTSVLGSKQFTINPTQIFFFSFTPPKAFYRLNATSVKISVVFFTELERIILKFIWNHQRPK